jgi:hypothetical protein
MTSEDPEAEQSVIGTLPIDIVTTQAPIQTSAVATTFSRPAVTPTSRWNGFGAILQDYCATPSFSEIVGPIATVVYYAGIVGCMANKPDCCPGQYGIAGSGLALEKNVFPDPADQSAEMLSGCPDDYELKSSFCCPR